MPLPVNFEQLVKLPPADGYPTTIKASDLMRNFAYCDLVAGEGVSIVDIPPTTAPHPQRRISVEGSGGIPEGFEIKRILICENGTPTAYDILARPVS